MFHVTFPIHVEKFRMIAGLDVDGDDFRGKPRGKFERLLGDLAPVLDGNDDDGRRAVLRGDHRGGAARSDADHVVVTANEAEKEDEQGNKNDSDPGAFGKFRDQDHDDGDAGNKSSKSIYQSALHPMRAAIFPPVHDHAELRERESQKSSHGVERDQFVRDAIEEEQQETRQQCKNDDAVGVDQATAAVSEGVRQIVVLGNRAAESREIGERGVCRKRKNEKNRSDGEVIKNAFAENGGDQHGEKALIAWLPRVCCCDAVNFDEIGNSRQQDSQKKNDDRQRALRVFHSRLAEGLHPVADGFDSRQRGAATCENFQQEPQRDGFGHSRRGRQRGYRYRMSATEGDTHESPNNRDEKSPDAESDGVRLQGGNGGDQRADAGGNAHGRGENVVRQQSRRREKSGKGAQVEARDGIGAAAGGIGRDRLAIRKIDDDQQRDDGCADRNNVLHSEQTERNQQAEGGFRAVSGGAEGVESEDGDAFLHADLFGALVAGLDGLADNGVEDVHKGLGSEKCLVSE